MSDPTPLNFTPPSVEELGQLLGAYEFKSFIAKGGMGAVYHARQRSLDREVAIKILPRELGADPAFFRSFETEARAMAKLNHPNLISVYDSGCVDGILYLVMELVPGESLYHKYYHQQVPPAEVVRLVKGICAGLAHAHENDVIHRDIKPANIILSAKGEPKIGDFGLAQQAGRGDGTGLAMGTPGYTAPEVTANPHSADRRSDLFAVGIILYELLTGQLPAEPAQMPSALCGCNPLFDKIFRRATHPSPTFRYASAEAFSAALDEALSSPAPPATTATGTPSTTGSPTPARRTTHASLAIGPKRPGAAVVAKRPAVAGPPGRRQAAAEPSPVAKRPGESEPGVTRAPAPASRHLPTAPTKPKSNSWLLQLILIIALGAGFYYAWKTFENQGTSQPPAHTRTAPSAVETQPSATDEPAAPQANSEVVAHPAPTPPAATPTQPAAESPLAALDRLKEKLARGDRDEFPADVFGFGDDKFLFVPQPMRWRQAREFAEAHGGHLAILSTSAAVELVANKLPTDTTVWIGAGVAGRGQWAWLDGNPMARPTGSGSYATLASLGLLLADKATAEHPFVIQWNTTGSDKTRLESTLQRAAEALAAGRTSFPVGTEASENRFFLLVERPLTWKQAAALAKSAGGNLAVPSTRTESSWIDEFLATELPTDATCWLGGRRSNATWTWTTQEPWTNNTFNKNSDPAATALAINPQGEWLALDPDKPAEAFLIEWSRDAPSQK